MSEIQIIVPIIIALTTSIFGPLLVKWVEKKFINKLNNDPLRDAIQHNEIIEQQLDVILQELECDQVYIAQFHNGGHFYPTGKSIQKFSIFYEKTTPDLPHLQHTFQNIPVSLFPRVLSKIYQDNEIAIDDVSTSEDTYGLEYLTTNFGTKSVCMLGLYSLDDHLIGVLGISFKKAHHLKRDEWVLIRQKAGAIGTLISEYLYATTKK